MRGSRAGRTQKIACPVEPPGQIRSLRPNAWFMRLAEVDDLPVTAGVLEPSHGWPGTDTGSPCVIGVGREASQGAEQLMVAACNYAG